MNEKTFQPNLTSHQNSSKAPRMILVAWSKLSNMTWFPPVWFLNSQLDGEVDYENARPFPALSSFLISLPFFEPSAHFWTHSPFFLALCPFFWAIRPFFSPLLFFCVPCPFPPAPPFPSPFSHQRNMSCPSNPSLSPSSTPVPCLTRSLPPPAIFECIL